MTNKNEHNTHLDSEYGVDSRYASHEEYQSEATALMEARLQRMKGLSNSQVVQAKLLQLKFQMQEFIKQPVNEAKSYFSMFLQQYIDTLYAKRAVFAKDIGITPVQLSQVINNHRAPQDDFILKLMIHSERMYKGVSPFPEALWYQVYFHEKLCNLMATQQQWQSTLAKEVSVSEPSVRYGKRKK
ncbi:hypothetical protein C8N46_104356 [Kordia periserrulae]|uniref:Helix-turn-helix protein n=1 Tax=Kordia periserrulae TaxID=701523 RepID=A0A2T6C064_9FLAO|nr:hypothetical protein [Kordia periserrulae]PTX61712.1 hypothetical protein C8N46_104356 [Kordia periserrulae]